MEGSERDSTQDWLIPEQAAPPLLTELVQRIDEALAIARVSEETVMTVGAAALDAADQARRAAELAERASAAMLDRVPRREGPARETAPRRAGFAGEPAGEESLQAFKERADRIAARLQRLVRLPLPASPELRGADRIPGRHPY
jgi:hypothetical protein